MKKTLVIINNEKCIKIGKDYFCENIEIKTLPKSLSNFFNVNLFVRAGNINPVHKINIKNVFIFKILSVYNFFFKKKFFNKNKIFLIISITPFTFLYYLFLVCFSKKIFLYLRSHGDQEFKYIIGSYSVWIYKICLFIMSLRSKLICVNDKIVKNDFFLVSPSQLNKQWFLKRKIGIRKKKINLLYFGRIKKEKGVYSLIKLYNNLNLRFNINLNLNLNLNIVGAGDKITSQSSKINIYPALSNVSEIIELYDKNQIIVLPSFTEGHPQVLLEALARLRPIIIFDDIKHIKKNYYGIFVSKRNSQSLKKTIINIVNKYNAIQLRMKSNNLPTHYNFIKNFNNILSN
jgi:glycosyltransferase involved in cell wall biosynthesis